MLVPGRMPTLSPWSPTEQIEVAAACRRRALELVMPEPRSREARLEEEYLTQYVRALMRAEMFVGGREPVRTLEECWWGLRGRGSGD